MVQLEIKNGKLSPCFCRERNRTCEEVLLFSRYGRGPSPDGSATTSRHVKDLAKRYLAHLEQRLQEKPRELLELWPRVIGPAFAGMTRAERYEHGILYVSVKNSSLLSLLHNSVERKRLVDALKKEAPGAEIIDISFRIGQFL